MNNSYNYKFFFILFLVFFLPHVVVAQTIGFTVVNSQIDENKENIVLSVERNSQGDTFLPPVSIDFNSQNGQAFASDDYQAVSGTLNWADNETGIKTINIPIFNDSIHESDESFTLMLSNCVFFINGSSPCNTSGGSVGLPVQLTVIRHVVTIIDDDVVGDINFSPTTYQVDEDQGTVTISVARNNGQSGDVSVNFQTVDKTANAGSDYQSTSGTLSWVDQEVGTKIFTVPILSDTLVEPSEVFEIRLSNATNGANIVTSTAEVSIEDTTNSGTLVFASTSITVNEGDTAQITVTRADGLAGALQWIIKRLIKQLPLVQIINPKRVL